MANVIPKREQIAEKDTWDLTGLFESDELWLSEYEALKATAEQVAEYSGTLADSAE